MSKNDVTGDEIKTKVVTKEYEQNYEKIFKTKKSKQEQDLTESTKRLIEAEGDC